jgi:hypothetical protein
MSDYMTSQYARVYNAQVLDNETKSKLKNSVMFNPLNPNAVSATGTTGVIPAAGSSLLLNQQGGALSSCNKSLLGVGCIAAILLGIYACK